MLTLPLLAQDVEVLALPLLAAGEDALTMSRTSFSHSFFPGLLLRAARLSAWAPKPLPRSHSFICPGFITLRSAGTTRGMAPADALGAAGWEGGWDRAGVAGGVGLGLGLAAAGATGAALLLLLLPSSPAWGSETGCAGPTRALASSASRCCCCCADSTFTGERVGGGAAAVSRCCCCCGGGTGSDFTAGTGSDFTAGCAGASGDLWRCAAAMAARSLLLGQGELVALLLPASFFCSCLAHISEYRPPRSSSCTWEPCSTCTQQKQQ